MILIRHGWFNRQDDHGNRFVVASDLSRRAAEQLVSLYEQRGHKQHYWAEDKKGRVMRLGTGKE